MDPFEIATANIATCLVRERTLALATLAHEPLCRVGLPVIDRRVAEWGGVRAELLTVKRGGPYELEFRMPSHLVMTHPDGASGGCEWSDGGALRKVATVPQRSLLLNPAHRYLRFRRKVRSRCQLLMLMIDPKEVARLAVDDFDAARVEFHQEFQLSDPYVRRTLLAIRDEIELPGPNGRLYRDTLVLVLLNQLVRCASNFATPRPPACAKGGLSGWRLKRALEMLEGDLTEGPSLAELAHHVGFHPTSFCRAFKQSIGVSPHRYLLERRVAAAKEMMADHGLTLTQIALDCGFGTSSQFSEIFRRLTGMSPSDYRRSL